jgi:hypothetical protein
LPLFLDPHTKRPREAPSRVDDVLGNLAPDNPLLRRVAHPKLPARDERRGQISRRLSTVLTLGMTA